jgi:AcrR family transcriptional regulator
MSPRKLDPRTRSMLLEIGARLLAVEGPEALSARRIAAEAGSSTMPLYSHFGGMRGLVREMVNEGFSRMHQSLLGVPVGTDPVADMMMLGRAYRSNAVANPHLYAVMFGGVSLAGFSLSELDRQRGRYTLAPAIECAARCVAAGRFREGGPELVAQQMWIAIHGLVTLELGRYLVTPYDADQTFEELLVTLMVGVGDDLVAASASVVTSRALAA